MRGTTRCRTGRSSAPRRRRGRFRWDRGRRVARCGTPAGGAAVPSLGEAKRRKASRRGPGRSIHELNRVSPVRPVFFEFDRADLTPETWRVLEENAAVLARYPTTWLVIIEGHCGELGTTDYNLALGERRAVAATRSLVTLGGSAPSGSGR